MERKVTRLGIGDSVRFLGWLSPEEVQSELAEAWACVVPSVWAEPQGLVALEAILRGVPVIASATGGLAEIVEDKRSGLLFPNGDERALLDCLRAIAAGSLFPAHTLCPEVVTKAAEQFSIEQHVRWIRGVFQEVIRSHHAVPKDVAL